MDAPNIYNLVFLNLKLLCMIHPDSQDVQKLLKQEMFKVPDAKAFQHVMNFLLNLVIPEKWKELIVWPVFDRKTESQFRRAVKKAFDEVNKAYSSENLPVARSAILTNAGGKDFAAFVFRLTVFILHKSLVEKYGISDLLSMQLNSSDNHWCDKVKLVAFREMTENSLQNFIDSSLGLTTAATERDIDMKLKDLKEDIKNEEQNLIKLIETLSLSEEMKQDLLDPKSSVGIEKWTAEVEVGMAKQNETMAVIEHICNEFSQCRQIIESSMEYASSGTCIDLSSTKKIMETKSQAILHEELPRISDIILEANNLLSEKANEIDKNGVPDLTTVLYSLRDLAAEFEDLQKNLNKRYSELESQLEELKNIHDAQKSEEIGATGGDKIVQSPDLNFYEGMNNGNSREAFFVTPKSGADNKKFIRKRACKPNFDSELLLSPNISNSISSPEDTRIEYRSVRTQPSMEFCVPQKNRFIPHTESKFKPQATNLSLITGSLLKTSSKFNVRGKALSTICNKKYKPFQREHNARHWAALFGKDNNSPPENSPTAFSPSADSEASIWDSAGDIKANALDLYSSISPRSEITSPSAILSSTKVEESEQTQKKKKKPRKSLEALIARYKKVVGQSKDLNVQKNALKMENK